MENLINARSHADYKCYLFLVNNIDNVSEDKQDELRELINERQEINDKILQNF